MNPEKENEKILFSTKNIEELFDVYKPMCKIFTSKIKINSKEVGENQIVSDLEMELKRALGLYVKNKTYAKEDYLFSSYFFYFIKEYLNPLIKSGIVSKIE